MCWSSTKRISSIISLKINLFLPWLTLIIMTMECKNLKKWNLFKFFFFFFSTKYVYFKPSAIFYNILSFEWLVTWHNSLYWIKVSMGFYVALPAFIDVYHYISSLLKEIINKGVTISDPSYSKEDRHEHKYTEITITFLHFLQKLIVQNYNVKYTVMSLCLLMMLWLHYLPCTCCVLVYLDYAMTSLNSMYLSCAGVCWWCYDLIK
jgi:hypothetical protein